MSQSLNSRRQAGVAEPAVAQTVVKAFDHGLRMGAVPLPVSPLHSEVVGPMYGRRVGRIETLGCRFTPFRRRCLAPTLEMLDQVPSRRGRFRTVFFRRTVFRTSLEMLDQVLGRGRSDRRGLFRRPLSMTALKMLDQIL